MQPDAIYVAFATLYKGNTKETLFYPHPGPSKNCPSEILSWEVIMADHIQNMG